MYNRDIDKNHEIKPSWISIPNPKLWKYLYVKIMVYTVDQSINKQDKVRSNGNSINQGMLQWSSSLSFSVPQPVNSLAFEAGKDYINAAWDAPTENYDSYEVCHYPRGEEVRVNFLEALNLSHAFPFSRNFPPFLGGGGGGESMDFWMLQGI